MKRNEPKKTWMDLKNVFLFYIEMATHSGTLAWKIPWMEEPGHDFQMPAPGLLEILSDIWRINETTKNLATNA